MCSRGLPDLCFDAFFSLWAVLCKCLDVACLLCWKGVGGNYDTGHKRIIINAIAHPPRLVGSGCTRIGHGM